MKETINQEVSVVMYFTAKKQRVVPYLLNWQNQDYKLASVSYHHSYMEGKDRQHIFELTDAGQTLHFRLRLNSSNLHWTLEAIHDGLAT